MKILHVIPGVAPRYGGPSQAVVEMCRALREAGAEVLLAATNADGDGVLPVKLGCETVYENVPAIFFPRQWSEAYKYSRPLAQWLDARAGDFDVIHIHAVFSHACLAAARAAQRAGVPYVVRPLGTLDPWSLKQKKLRKRLFWHLGVGRMLRDATAVHYTALPEKELAERELELSKGVVIPLGLELSTESETETTFRARYPQLGNAPYVLMLSRLHPKKGQDLMLQAFLSLNGAFTDWKLVLAGTGEPGYTAELQRLVHENAAAERVIFAGWLDGARKNAALRYAGLLALPSRQENFGLCVIESLSWGVPVLVSEGVNLAPDIVNNGVGWVTGLEKQELATHLAAALRGGPERERKGQAGRAFAESFSWPRIAGLLLELYRSVGRK